MAPVWAVVSALLVAACAPATEAKLIGESAGQRFELDIAKWKYFGPSKPKILHDVPMTWLSGDEVCNPDPTAVAGRVVFSDNVDVSCYFIDVAAKLHRKGALPI